MLLLRNVNYISIVQLNVFYYYSKSLPLNGN